MKSEGEKPAEEFEPLDTRTISPWAQAGVYLVVFGILAAVLLVLLPDLVPFVGDVRGFGVFGFASAVAGICMVVSAVIRYYVFTVPPRWYIRASMERVFYGRRWLHHDRSQWAGKLTYHLPVKINQRKGYAEQQFWLHDSRASIEDMREALRSIRRVQDVDLEPVLDKRGRVKWLCARFWFVTRDEAYGRG